MALSGSTATFVVGATTVTFKMLLDGAAFDRKAAVSVRHIPGANVNYYDNGGMEAPTLKCRALVDTYADLIALQGMLGPDGTLTNSEAAYTVKLLSVGQTRVTGRGSQRFLSLEFVQVV